ncbi:MAG TPA: L,D-transpeptidase family protein [Firmicutes bacterium]|nr:L,D-transpeptidase family protein [Bacillota bacterium]
MATRSLPLTEGKPRSEKNKKEPLVFAIIVYLFLSAFPVYLPVRARATSYGVECRCRPEAELSLGMENEDVLELQKFLKSKGFYSPTPSGLYDQKTARAVQSFQTAHGLPVNGKVDGSTWSAIGRISLGEPVATSPPPGELVIIVDTKDLTLTVLVDKQPFKVFPVSIGKRETPSPVGDWIIVNKGSWSGGFGTRWLGLSVPYGRYGIHGTNKPWSIGRMESHGCIRMFNRDVEELYRWVKRGDKVRIIGDPFMGRRRLVKGERGADVWFLQKRLRQLGYYQFSPDGVFGYGTEAALKNFQKDHHLPVTGQVGWREYNALRLLSEE